MLLLLLWAIAVVSAGLELRSALAQHAPNPSTSGAPRATDIKVLFIGNSFTFYNEMPLMIAKLAASNHESRRLYVRTWAPGGTGLNDHARDSGLTDLLRTRTWDVVVMQERSLVPSVPSLRPSMLAAGRYLQSEIRQQGARSMLYETWGYRAGAGPGDSFSAMESRTEAGYEALATALGRTTIVPVGPAFAYAELAHPGTNLWDGDGMHPSAAGSYLAACVFYRALYAHDALGAAFTGNLTKTQAQELQEAADAAVR